MAMVVSAMGKETDELLHMASQISDVPDGREMDMLITAGERKACALICIALAEVGVQAHSFTGSQAGFLTDTNHQISRPMPMSTSASSRPIPPPGWSGPVARPCSPSSPAAPRRWV